MSNYFTLNDGLKYEFERRFNAETHGKQINNQEDMTNEFPINKKQLVEKYVSLERILNERWHPNANLGAAIQGNGLLTDHGVDHINAVMYHGLAILGTKLRYLSGYEIYLLLLAIHFHDLGNIYGREQHEEKIGNVMQNLGEALELDGVEREFVFAIAKAHGGYNDGDKDTIRYVNVDETCNGVQVRAKMLAAVLRFADEISDDFSRAAYDNIEIPKENKVFHLYSKVLEPVSIQGETIKFHFRIPYEYTQNRVGKGNEEVFLYDEILNRLTKCMRELEYCRKYANGFINITTLSVKIDLMSEKSLFKAKERFSFRLNLLGYPSERVSDLENYLEIDEIEGANSQNIPKYRNGEELKKAMKGEKYEG